ncbi:MAG TPA: diguanylate cyclase [Thermotogota bacterium]|nr:diguanylate cyclase [Thermotogota bacterium]HRW34009.1 diguanylate cyclase [Thermotogota bacterium]
MSEKQTILIVDDVTQNIIILNATLKEEYNTLFAKNGEEALKVAKETKPDLILLDVMMPGMNGFEVCSELKKDEELKNIPIIFVTALNDTGNESEGLNLGAVDYIRKPFNIDIVKLRVRNHLQMKQNRDKLLQLSNTDRLTGIANRRGIMEVFERELKRAVRNQTPIGFSMLDIDFFKLYNDNYGHLAGDITLHAVAQTLSNTLKRPTDIAGRFGGEEFLCILPDTDKQGMQKISNDMLQAIFNLSIPHHYSKVSNVITVSIGACALIPEYDKQVEYYVNLADMALYQSKNNGRNQITFCKNSGT